MTGEQIMSDYISKFESIIGRMETQGNLTEERFKMYQDSINKDMELHRERMADFEKREIRREGRWVQIRNITISFVSLFLLVVFTGGIKLAQKTSVDDVNNILKKKEFAAKEDLVRGLGIVIDGTYETFEQTDEISHDEAKDMKSEIKDNVAKEIFPNERSRSLNK